MSCDIELRFVITTPSQIDLGGANPTCMLHSTCIPSVVHWRKYRWRRIVAGASINGGVEWHRMRGYRWMPEALALMKIDRYPCLNQ